LRVLDVCRCGCDDPALTKPSKPRVRVYIDGQNLFRAAHRCFNDIDVPYANYDPIALARMATARITNAGLQGVHFYTGVPKANLATEVEGHDLTASSSAEKNLSNFWRNKLQHYSAKFSLFHRTERPLFYERQLQQRFGKIDSRWVGREKGIDVCLALDCVLGAVSDEFDVAIIFSQDNDLNEAVKSLRSVRGRIGRWIHIENVFPMPDTATVLSNQPGYTIDKTGLRGAFWRPFEREAYIACVDKYDFRPKFITGAPVEFTSSFEMVRHVARDCSRVPNQRQLIRYGQRFPPCPVCKEAVIWARYLVFRD